MRTSSANDPRPGGLSGWHVLSAMLGFFAVIIVADATMIYKAVSTFGGVDNANAYRDGLAYNARIASEARQSAQGWRDKVAMLADPARLKVSLATASGHAPDAVKVEATLGRPATNSADAVLQLAEVQPGQFEAPVGRDLAPGTWIVTVRVLPADATTAEGEPLYRNRRRLWVAP